MSSIHSLVQAARSRYNNVLRTATLVNSKISQSMQDHQAALRRLSAIDNKNWEVSEELVIKLSNTGIALDLARKMFTAQRNTNLLIVLGHLEGIEQSIVCEEFGDSHLHCMSMDQLAELNTQLVALKEIRMMIHAAVTQHSGQQSC